TGRRLADPPQRFDYVLATVECAEAEVPFAQPAEPAARRADDVCLGQELVEVLPARRIARRLHPDIGCGSAAVDREASALQALADQLRVAEIKLDELPHLALADFGVDRLRA